VLYFQETDRNQFSIKSLIFKGRKQQLCNRSLGETSIRHCKIICRFGVDIGTKSATGDFICRFYSYVRLECSRIVDSENNDVKAQINI
jgi:hypothetical protein